jgi:hypothetical protein
MHRRVSAVRESGRARASSGFGLTSKFCAIRLAASAYVGASIFIGPNARASIGRFPSLADNALIVIRNNYPGKRRDCAMRQACVAGPANNICTVIGFACEPMTDYPGLQAVLTAVQPKSRICSETSFTTCHGLRCQGVHRVSTPIAPKKSGRAANIDLFLLRIRRPTTPARLHERGSTQGLQAETLREDQTATENAAAGAEAIDNSGPEINQKWALARRAG